MSKKWFEDAAVVRRLPLLFRLHAFYCGLVWRYLHTVRGCTFLHARVARLTRALGLPDSATVRVGRLEVCVNLCDLRWVWVVNEVRGTNEEAALLKSVLGQGDTFLDIGANHGSYSLVAAQIVGENGRIVAFEPQPQLATLIRRSFRKNRMKQATVFSIACSDQVGEVEFYIPQVSSGSAGIHKAFSGANAHRKVKVKTDTIDNCLRNVELPGKVVAKLDVEGSEIAALRGASHLFSTRRPLLLFELNPSSARAAGQSPQELLHLLGELGYTQCAEIDSYPQAIPLEEVECEQQRNLIAFLKSGVCFA